MRSQVRSRNRRISVHAPSQSPWTRFSPTRMMVCTASHASPTAWEMASHARRATVSMAVWCSVQKAAKASTAGRR
jgi:hypothetical protein